MRTGGNAPTAPKMSSLFGLKVKLLLTKTKIQKHKHTSAAIFKARVKLEKPPVGSVDCFLNQNLCLQERKDNYIKETPCFGNTSSPVNIRINCIVSI